MQFEREMNNDERDLLKCVLFDSPLSTKSWFYWLLAGFIVCSFIVSMTSRHVVKLEVPEQWTMYAAIYSLWITVTLLVFRKLRKIGLYQEIKNDLQEGKVIVSKQEFEEALLLETDEELGQSFILKLADGTSFFFIGDHLCENFEKGEFPNTSIETVNSFHSNIELDLKLNGNYLTPIKIIKVNQSDIDDLNSGDEVIWQDWFTK